MKKLLFLLWLLCASPAFGTLRYIDNAGTNAGGCTLIGSPCLTFAYAIGQMVPGDTLIVQDGTYTKATNGYILLSAVCTALAPCTIRADHERLAYLQGNGTDEVVKITGDYWTVDGLRWSDLDNVAGQPIYNHVSRIYVGADNNTIKHCLIYQDNRYNNAHLLLIQGTGNLIEDNEFMDFHRGAVSIFGANGNIVRRNYANSTEGPRVSPSAAGLDLPGTGCCPGRYVSINPSRGDEDFFAYPGNDNIFENNISENSNAPFFAQGIGTSASARNKFYGNIAIGAVEAFGAYTSGANALGPIDTQFTNNLALNAATTSFNAATSRGTRFDNCTSIGAGVYGFQWDRTSTFDSAPLTGFSDSSLAVTSARGFSVDTIDFGTWLINFANAFSNSTFNYSPSSNANLINSTVVDPALGSCKAWIPVGSPMKGSGKNGSDKGATILYEYAGGVLTSIPLWDSGTNNFVGCGVEVTGVNDTGVRCTTVDARLSVGVANGCAFPAGYGNFTLTDPVTGGDYQSGSTRDVTWTTAGSANTVTIEYSTNSGSTWASIVNGTANDGSYPWTLPIVQSSTVRARVKLDSTATVSSSGDFSVGDSIHPTISITGPANGATVSSASVSVDATASDNIGVVGVQFKLDGSNLGTEDTSVPYGLMWDSTTASNAVHVLTAIARDAAGNTTTSAAISVTVANAGPDAAPTVSITFPSNGDPVSGTITVTANATDDVSVSGVQFKLDGVNLGSEDTSFPYSVSWATTSVVDGAHQLLAVARDGAGHTTTSTAVNVIVSNPPPTISGISAGSITSSAATITWQTSTASSSQVDYGTTTGYGSSTVLNASLVTSHSQGLTGLAAFTLYHYRVKSADVQAQLTVSGDNTFTTAAVGATTITVTSPAGGETWTKDSTHAITWDKSVDLTGNIRVLVSRNGGSTFRTIVNSVAASAGTVNWSVKPPSCNNCVIRVNSLTNPSVFDNSATFRITN